MLPFLLFEKFREANQIVGRMFDIADDILTASSYAPAAFNMRITSGSDIHPAQTIRKRHPQ